MDKFVHDTAEAIIFPGWGIPPEFYWDSIEKCSFSSVDIFDYGFFQDSDEPMNLPSGEDEYPPVLIGHSMGAMFAVRAALQDPESVRRLILINPFPCFVRKEDFSCGWEKTTIELMRKNLKRKPAAQLTSFLRMCASPGTFNRTLPEILNVRALDDGLLFLETEDVRPELPLLEEVSVICLESEADAIVNPLMTDAIVDACGALCKVIPGGTHLTMLDDPAACAAQFRDLVVL